jgi:hypothetical protein
MGSKRIPISRGFYIQLSTDGRALSSGLPDDKVLPTVEDWLTTHEGHADHSIVEQWIQQKRAQVDEDSRLQEVRKEREQVNTLVDRAIRQSGTSLPKELKKVIRDPTFSRR